MSITFNTLRNLFKKDKEIINKLQPKHELAMRQESLHDKYQSIKEDAEKEIQRQRNLNQYQIDQAALQQHKSQLLFGTSSMQMSPSQWRSTPSYMQTTRDVNSLSDREKADFITNMMLREGLKVVGLDVLREVHRRLSTLDARNNEQQQPIKQPKKKLNL